MQIRKWASRIKSAEKVGAFDVFDKVEVQRWHTCAVGEALGIKEDLTHVVEDTIGHGPAAEKLKELGHEFSYAVRYDDITSAKRLFRGIKAFVQDLAR